MYKSIERIQKLRKEKQAVLNSVYQSNSLDDIYERQKVLGSMAVSIYTDVANTLMPVFQEDGVSNIVWSNISLRLKKLSFISIPTASEIREKYKQGLENPTIVKIDGTTPKLGEKRKVKIELPTFLAMLVAQGIAVPLILNIFGVPKLALVLVDASLMTIEVVAYFGVYSKRGKKKLPEPTKGTTESTEEYEKLYRKAIKEVYNDNSKTLNNWFDALESIAKEEIDKALGNSGGSI